ncbi:MAG: hypothetical protein M0P74_13500 [Syntrophales bacterium]|nr:hypothetical protein [Syntrophales bacterium]
MDSDQPDWQSDFPRREEFEDFLGKKRAFVVDCHEGLLGYTVRAREEKPKGKGYEFAVYSETSPYNALGRLRDKARQSMATRYLGSGHDMLHDKLRGRITSDGNGGVLLVVDGLAVDMGELSRFFSIHEGWEFELKIKDALE